MMYFTFLSFLSKQAWSTLDTPTRNMAAANKAAKDPEATQAFPNPPSLLYKLYTDEAVESGTAPKPPPPAKGHYQMFGAPFNVNYI